MDDMFHIKLDTHDGLEDIKVVFKSMGLNTDYFREVFPEMIPSEKVTIHPTKVSDKIHYSELKYV